MQDKYQANFIWQHDNAPAHRSRVVRDVMEDEDVIILPWPAYSPDCNPIGNYWDTLKRAVDQLEPAPVNLYELEAALQEQWQKIGVQYINNLVDSMPRRIRSVIAARGGHEGY